MMSLTEALYTYGGGLKIEVLEERVHCRHMAPNGVSPLTEFP